MKYALIGLFILASCCSPQKLTISTDEAMVNISRDIQQLIGEAYPTVFGNPGPGNLAVCLHGSHIIVDRFEWDRHDDVWRFYLLLHENGHCVLGRSHYDEMEMVDGYMRPVSVMHRNVFLVSKFPQWKAYYVQELLSHVP